MNSILAITTFTLVVTSCEGVEFFETKLDYSDNNSEIIKLEYYTYNKTYVNGPAYLYIGGEGAIGDGFFGPLKDLANVTKGVIFSVAHRCYSNYQNDTLWSHTQRINYCNSHGALQDLANFMKWKGSQLKPGNKWIAVGGSYAGRLAAQLRGYFPDLVHGAWSSSAPLISKFPFQTESTEAIIKAIAANCETARPHFVNKKYVLDDYEPDLTGACSNIIVIVQLLWKAAVLFVQNNEHRDERNNSITDFCKKIGVYNCAARNLEGRLDEKTQYHVWHHQACTEFGWSTADIEYARQYCHNYKGPEWNEEDLQKRIEKDNEEMDRMLTSASRILLVYGSTDYWTKASPTKSYPGVTRIDIPGGSHCKDLKYSRWNFQNELLKDYRVKIFNTIKEWLNED